MKLEVGIFIRTPLGIDKIICLRIQDEYGCNYDTQLEHYLFLNNKRDYISIDGECFEKEEIKTSYNLLGNDKEPCLIEVGDYVNGHRVVEVDLDDIDDYGNDFRYIKTEHDFTLNHWVKEYEIETIVTKEQFSSMEYRLGDDK